MDYSLLSITIIARDGLTYNWKNNFKINKKQAGSYDKILNKEIRFLNPPDKTYKKFLKGAVYEKNLQI